MPENLGSCSVGSHDLGAALRFGCQSSDDDPGDADDADCDAVDELGVGEFEGFVIVMVDDDRFCAGAQAFMHLGDCLTGGERPALYRRHV